MISKFQGEFRWLSNFTDVQVEFEGVMYPSVENAYVAAKTHDKVLRSILTKITSAEAKRLGRSIPIRSDWDEIKYSVMKGLIKQKFSYKWFEEKLLLTGDREIVEGNSWHDNYWGICDCSECFEKSGQNNLGKLLMEIREGLVQPSLDFSKK
jgi:ribA/ribD-fused uncharacterized protein